MMRLSWSRPEDVRAGEVLGARRLHSVGRVVLECVVGRQERRRYGHENKEGDGQAAGRAQGLALDEAKG